VRTHRRHNSTRQLSRVGVGGVYWALEVKKITRRKYALTGALQVFTVAN